MNNALAIGLNLVTGLLADDQPRDTGPDFGKASPVGLVIVVLLLIGTFFLVRSMNRHLRKLPESFDTDNPEPDQAADDGTVDLEDGGAGERPSDTGSTRREPG